MRASGTLRALGTSRTRRAIIARTGAGAACVARGGKEFPIGLRRQTWCELCGNGLPGVPPSNIMTEPGSARPRSVSLPAPAEAWVTVMAAPALPGVTRLRR